MAIQRVEVITGTERRRQFTEEEKLRLVEEAFEPGVRATEVARRRGVDVSLLYRWRRLFYGRPPRIPAFTPVTVCPDEAPAEDLTVSASEPAVGTIEIDFAIGARLRITGAADPAVVAAAVAALAGRAP